MSWSSCGRLVRSVVQVGAGTVETVPCKAGVRTFGDFWLRHAHGGQDLRSSSYLDRVRLSGDVRRVRELLDRNNASVFILRPDVRGAHLSDVLEDFTSREFVASCGAAVAAHGLFGGGFADSRRPGDAGGRAVCAQEDG